MGQRLSMCSFRSVSEANGTVGLCALACATLIIAASAKASDTFYWIADANGGDGFSFHQEANWDSDGDGGVAPYVPPPAGSINAISQSPNFINGNIVATFDTLGGGAGVSRAQFFADRFVHLSGTAWLRMHVTFNGGLRRDNHTVGDNAFTMDISDQAMHSARNINEAVVTVRGEGVVALDGTTDPINHSVINLATQRDARLFLTGLLWQSGTEDLVTYLGTQSTPNTVLGAPSDRLLVGGAEALWGSDPYALEPGDTALAILTGQSDPFGRTYGTFDFNSDFPAQSGTWVIAVPEPASAALLVGAGLCLLRRGSGSRCCPRR